jgi:hypothetical protein
VRCADMRGKAGPLIVGRSLAVAMPPTGDKRRRRDSNPRERLVPL